MLKTLVMSAPVASASSAWIQAQGGSQELVVGFIYEGAKDDFGHSQAHFTGQNSLFEVAGLKITNQDNVSGKGVLSTMRGMIELEGVSTLFLTAFDYFDPHILSLAQEYPQVHFFHAGRAYQEGKHPPNIGSYYGYQDEVYYLAGILAAHTTQTGKLGFIGSDSTPEVLRALNSFVIGSRQVDPEISTQAIFSGTRLDPSQIAAAAKQMVDQKVDLITGHIDQPRIIVDLAQSLGIFSIGSQVDQRSLAPESCLTSTIWNWGTVYRYYIQRLQQGKTLINHGIPHLVMGGLKEEFCDLSPYGIAVSKEAKRAVETAKNQLIAGETVVYAGEIKSHEGEIKISAAQRLALDAPELESIDWLVEGVIGRLPRKKKS
jgi:simple sugar transport system substrate-binding protein